MTKEKIKTAYDIPKYYIGVCISCHNKHVINSITNKCQVCEGKDALNIKGKRRSDKIDKR